MYGTAKNRILELRATGAVCQNSRKMCGFCTYFPYFVGVFTRMLDDPVRILLKMR
jgi:hypothetical protein